MRHTSLIALQAAHLSEPGLATTIDFIEHGWRLMQNFELAVQRLMGLPELYVLFTSDNDPKTGVTHNCMNLERSPCGQC